MKFCKKCGSNKPISDYYAHQSTKDKLWPYCKPCVSKQSAAYRERNKSKIKQLDADYRRANKDRVLANKRAHYEANRQVYIDRAKAWLADHAELRRVYVRKRRARIHRVESTLTPKDVSASMEYFGHRCAYCLRTGVKLTVDHIRPISAGGPDTADNIVPACQSCNSSKNDHGILWMLNRCASASR